jgi:hypothetical protein
MRVDASPTECNRDSTYGEVDEFDRVLTDHPEESYGRLRR